MTEIYINSTKVDVSEDINISLTYSIADVSQPDKRQSTYSKTVTLPATKINDVVFSEVWMVNMTDGWDSSQKANAEIWVDGIRQFTGFVKLNKVNNTNGLISYDVTFIGEVANLFKDIGEGYLTDLDFSEYNHTYNFTNISNSWDTSIIKNSSGYVNFSGGNPIGEGYIYPFVDNGLHDRKWTKVRHWRAGFYFKDVVDKIFEGAGYQYSSSSYFTDQDFKDLILFPNKPMYASGVTNYAYDIQATGAPLLDLADYQTSGGQNGYPFNHDTINSDPSSYVNTRTYWSDTATNIETDLKFTHQLKVRVTGNYQINAQRSFTVKIYESDSGNNNIQAWNINTYNFSALEGAFDLTFSVDFVPSPNRPNSKYMIILPSLDSASGGTCNITGIYVTMDRKEALAVEGDTVDLSKSLPDGYKQKDFLMDCVRMHNLYMMPNPDFANEIIVKPKNTFYTSTTVKDWTAKLDKEKEFTIIPNAFGSWKEAMFTYKEDKDYHNELYTATWNEVYGQKDIEVDNDFFKGSNDVKINLSATPLVGSYNDARVLPAIYKLKDNGTKEPFIGNPRVFTYGGMLSNAAITNPFAIIQDDGTVQYPNNYLFCGHLDDPYSPTKDINFGLVREVYYQDTLTNTITLTNNTLYNQFYKKDFEEISDKDTRMIEAHFYLTPFDLMNFDFRDNILVENTFYRIHKIIDADISKGGSIKVQLQKINTKDGFSASTTPPSNLPLNPVF